MSKFSQAFGEKFEQRKKFINSRTFEIGGYTFRVRIPSTSEIEAIFNVGDTLDENVLNAEYQNLIKGIEGIESAMITKTEDDILVDGRSMRQAAKNKLMLQSRITEYFKLLIPEEGQSLEDLTYSDIDLVFPMAVQMSFLDRINEVISPDYKEARGKS